MIRDQYALNTKWYGPSKYKQLEVIGELNKTPGQSLIGNTGVQGCHVPDADCVSNMKLKQWSMFIRHAGYLSDGTFIMDYIVIMK